MLKILNEEHEGIGGLYFICVNIICAFIMGIALYNSWASQAISIADNVAYIVSLNSNVFNYLSKSSSYTKINPTLTRPVNVSYNPLNDFNKMMKNHGIMTSEAKQCVVKYDGNGRTSIQIGEFNTSLNIKIRPHKQESVVEEVHGW